MTDLEAAVWRAAVAMRDADFGTQLRAYDPRLGRAQQPGSLAQWEVQNGPPLHRTLFALEFCSITGSGFDRHLEAGYLQWVSGALQAMGSYASRCWGDIPLDLRIAVVDEDDLGVIHSRYIPATRHGPVDQQAEAFGGLGAGQAREAFVDMTREVTATDCYVRALASVRDLRRHRGRRGLEKYGRRIRTRLDEIQDQADNVLAAGPPLHEYIHNVYQEALPGVSEAGQAVQALNELIQAVLWTLLGVAEQPHDPQPFALLPSACRLRREGRHHDLSVTTGAFEMVLHGSPPSPFAIAAGTPIDGIYLTRSQLVQLMFEPLADVTGRSLGALEAAA
jgi:hypothetical protein